MGDLPPRENWHLHHYHAPVSFTTFHSDEQPVSPRHPLSETPQDGPYQDPFVSASIPGAQAVTPSPPVVAASTSQARPAAPSPSTSNPSATSPQTVAEIAEAIRQEVYPNPSMKRIWDADILPYIKSVLEPSLSEVSPSQKPAEGAPGLNNRDYTARTEREDAERRGLAEGPGEYETKYPRGPPPENCMQYRDLSAPLMFNTNEDPTAIRKWGPRGEFEDVHADGRRVEGTSYAKFAEIMSRRRARAILLARQYVGVEWKQGFGGPHTGGIGGVAYDGSGFHPLNSRAPLTGETGDREPGSGPGPGPGGPGSGRPDNSRSDDRGSSIGASGSGSGGDERDKGKQPGREHNDYHDDGHATSQSFGKGNGTRPSDTRLPTGVKGISEETVDSLLASIEQQQAELCEQFATKEVLEDKLEAERERKAAEREQLIAKWQEANERQRKAVIELQIQVAVLENDLKHANLDKQAAIGEARALAKVLASNLSSAPMEDIAEEIDDLKRQLKTLKEVNDDLRKRLGRRKLSKACESLFPTTSSDSSDFDTPPSGPRHRTCRGEERLPEAKHTNPPAISDFTSNDKGKGKVKEREEVTDSAERRVSFEPIFSTSESGTNLMKTCSHRHVYSTSLGDNTHYTGKNFAGSSDYGGSTIPNYPLMSTTIIANKPSPIDANNINTNVRSQPLPDVDVGMKSLEEVLGDHDFPTPKMALLSPGVMSGDRSVLKLNSCGEVVSITVDEDRAREVGMGFSDLKGSGIDVELDQYATTTGKLEELPKPGILKMGFEVSRSFRGQEYDHLKEGGSLFRGLPSGPRRSGPSTLTRLVDLSRDSTGVSEDPVMFDSAQQIQNAVNIHKRDRGHTEARHPEFFRYGVRFVPDDDETNVLRTVHITNLPSDIQMRDVLARVRGGRIDHAILCNTVLLTGSMTALVYFLHEHAAERYVLYAMDHPITFGEEAQEAVITLLPTPTWPLKYSTRCAISELNHSRMLSIPNFPENMSISLIQRTITHGNGHRANLLVEIFLSAENTLHLEFSSINAAGSAYGILTNFMSFKDLVVCWEPDPCAGPLVELELPIKPRPPMLPRHRMTEGPAAITPRKTLTALGDQHVVIPTFSGKGIQSSSWADEMNDKFENSAEGCILLARPTFQLKEQGQFRSHDETTNPPNSPPGTLAAIPRAMSVEDFSQAMVRNSSANHWPVFIASHSVPMGVH